MYHKKMDLFFTVFLFEAKRFKIAKGWYNMDSNVTVF